MSRLPVDELSTASKELDLNGAKVYHLPNWGSMTHPQRLTVLREIAMSRGRDPRIAKIAVDEFRRRGVMPRQYKRQAEVLLKWVQNPKNVYYVNEPGERLQDPIYTIETKVADCDDMVLVLTALFESVNLPWRLVISGRADNGTGPMVRHIEGDPVPPGVKWTHIYCMVGTPPFHPIEWWFCEPTIEGVPLGWDVIDGDKGYLPELMKPPQGPPRVYGAPPFTFNLFKTRTSNPSPALLEALGESPSEYGQSTSALVGGVIGSEMQLFSKDTAKKIALAVATGVLVSVLSQVVIRYVLPDMRRST